MASSVLPEVTLHDGRVTNTYSEDWKIECLANFVLSLDFEKRKPWIDDVRLRAGEEAARVLGERVTAIYQARKAEAVRNVSIGYRSTE